MTTDATTDSKQAEEPQTVHVENSTDATRGEPLAMRAQKRRLELAKALEGLPADELRARQEIELTMASIDSLLTGDLEHLCSDDRR